MDFCQPLHINIPIVLVAGQLHVLKLIFLALPSMGKLSDNPVNWAAISQDSYNSVNFFNSQQSCLVTSLFSTKSVVSMHLTQVLFQLIMDNDSFVFFILSHHILGFRWGSIYTKHYPFKFMYQAPWVNHSEVWVLDRWCHLDWFCHLNLEQFSCLVTNCKIAIYKCKLWFRTVTTCSIWIDKTWLRKIIWLKLK